MLIRRMLPEEKPKVRVVQAVAYDGSWEPPQPDAPLSPDPFYWWIAEEDQTIHTCVGVLPLNVRFDGHTVSMGGVGGVASLPNYRRRGAVRECIRGALHEMYESGNTFSSLYPFSRAFYRKFGYEDGAAVCRWNIAFEALDLPDVGGTMELVLPGGDVEPVLEAYKAWCGRWNLASEKTRLMEKLRSENWMKDRRYLYLWRDASGVPAGAIMLTKREGEMDCTTSFTLSNFLYFRDAAALSALLSFTKRFAADYKSVRFSVPANVRLENLIAEGNKAERKLGYNGMVRIVNVEKALGLCACRGEGSIRIAVADNMIEANNGVWQLNFANGSANKVCRTDVPADVEMPIGQLSQLILGVLGAADIPMMPLVRVNNADAPLESVFYQKRCMITDLF